MTSENEKGSAERWVYMGKRMSNKGLRGAWARLSHVTDPDEMMLFKALCKYPAVGGIYKVLCNRQPGGGVTAYGTPIFLEAGGADTPEQEMDWSALEAEAEAEHRRKRSEKDARRNDLLLKQLDPLRRAYWKTNVRGRRALLAQFIEYIGRRPR